MLREVELETLLELRERVLTPGHPGRPVIWPCDGTATRYGMCVEDQLIGCVSITAQEVPEEVPVPAALRPFHLHSMAVEPGWQGHALGREMLTKVTAAVASQGGDLIWATARPSAVEFLPAEWLRDRRRDARATNALMRYVWLALT